MYAFRPALTSHISCVHVPVKAIGKKSKSVFLCPKLSLSRICFGPSGTLAGNVKSGALVPTASGINNPPVRVSREKFTIRSTCKWSKGLRRNCGHGLTRIHTDTSRDWEEVFPIEHPCSSVFIRGLRSRQMELFWWLFTIVLFAVGLIGTIAPVLPGT